MSDLAAGMLLVATPALMDPHFVDTVVLLLDADDDGALGVVLNRPSPVPVGEVLAGWADHVSEPDVLYRGGPVSVEGALAVAELVDPRTAHQSFRPVIDALALLDLDASVDDVQGDLRHLRVFAGYAGWGSGQLTAEVAEGSWYVVPGEVADVFRADATGLRRDVLRRQPGELAWRSTRPVDPDLN